MVAHRLHTKRDCEHTTVHHEHGTITAYTEDGCRCDDCADASADHRNWQRRLRAYGRHQPFLVDAYAAREHLLALRANGIGFPRAAELAGLGKSTASKIVSGYQKTVSRETEAKILAIPLEVPKADNRAIDGTGTRRRIQALIAVGWSCPKLEARLGLSKNWTDQLLKGGNVTPANAEKVRALYDELWDKRPPAPQGRYEKTALARTLRWAKENGFALPLAWDDETIDDPAAQPVVEQRRDRKRYHLKEDVVEDMDWLRSNGASAGETARRMGMTLSGLEQAAVRAGRRDLASWCRNERHREWAA
jgi:transcriptional regulator with XRE-family HTH domain